MSEILAQRWMYCSREYRKWGYATRPDSGSVPKSSSSFAVQISNYLLRQQMGSSRQQLCAIQIVDTHETEEFNEFAIRLLCLQDSFILGDFVPLN